MKIGSYFNEAFYWNAFFSNYSNETNEIHADEEQMNISQEILVLDFGDEKNDFLRSETDFSKGMYK